MTGFAISPSTLTALVVAVGFAAGLNVYATVLALGVMARMHWAALPPGLEMLGHGWVLGASAVLFAAEFVADKIPVVDVVWNALHTFVRIPVAGLLAYQATTHLSPGLQVLATCLGATVAAVAHGGKTAARVAVTPSPEPVSNIALSTAEDGVAVGLTWVAVHHPWIGGGVAFGLAAGMAGMVWWGYRRVAGAWRRFRGNWRPMGAVRRV